MKKTLVIIGHPNLKDVKEEVEQRARQHASELISRIKETLVGRPDQNLNHPRQSA